MITVISLDELPKTFKEAIYLVRSLGICYIWIDSLCIIQDSVEDVSSWTDFLFLFNYNYYVYRGI